MTYGRDWRSGFNSLPIAGGFLSSIWGDPAEEANAAAMAEAVRSYKEYRPENINARMNAFHSMSNVFSPMNNLMGQMYGPGAQIDMSKVVQNPFSQGYMDDINAQASGSSKSNKPSKLPGPLSWVQENAQAAEDYKKEQRERNKKNPKSFGGKTGRDMTGQRKV